MIISLLKVIMFLLKVLAIAAMRGLAGFVAGFIVAIILVDRLLYSDPRVPEIVQQDRAVPLALYIAYGVAFVSVLAGGIRISKYWLWSCVTFGVIWLIPFWQYKIGVIVPLGTIYTNRGFRDEYLILCLAVHVVVSLLMVAIVRWAYSRKPRRPDCA